MATISDHQHKTNHERITCRRCSPPSLGESWTDFLDAYPNQYNEIQRKGPEAFDWPPREEWYE